MKNYIQKGDNIEVVAPSGGYTSGQLVTVGSLVGVAANDAAENETCVVNLCGVYEVPKAAGAITQGAIVYHDPATGNVTTTAGSLKQAGHAFVGAASGDATAFVKLMW